MPLYEIPNNHTMCRWCHSFFPKSWITQGIAIREGTETFCSKSCSNKEMERNRVSSEAQTAITHDIVRD